MSFEIVNRDLLARIGRFQTKSGVIETPLLLPVINPNVQTVLPKTLEKKFGCRALITNAYIIQKNFKETASEKGLHDFLNFNGSIMSDSGAYQLLIYKDIETSPEEIVHFQEKIDTDIATILDVPTGWGVSKKYARPLHLFGAGHPFMFSLAVALGCDLFDSAAYALFARTDRYMTESGTTRLGELEYFPCSCPVCNKTDPKSVKALPKEDRQKLLAEHNLHISFCELRQIKQAITEGRLWEHLEMRAHAHPALLQAVKKLGKYSEYLEKQSPITKRNGIFFFSSLGLARPEVVCYSKRFVDRYSPPPKTKILLLLPQTGTKPFHNSKEHETVRKEMLQSLGDRVDLVHVCTYAAPFGIIPTELDDVYPLSQNEIASPFDAETVMYVAKQAANYIKNTNYDRVILLRDPKVWRGKIAAACRRACKKKQIPFTMLRKKDPWAKNTIEHLASIIKEAVMVS